MEPKSAPQKIEFEAARHTRGAYFHVFHTNGQIAHTCVGPQKLRRPRAPRSLNPSLVATCSSIFCPPTGSAEMSPVDFPATGKQSLECFLT